jgi:hypothetical protein
MVEKFNGTLATTMAKLMYERKTNRWIDLIDEALFSYRVTKGVTKKTPYEIFYCRKPNLVYSLPGEEIREEIDEEGEDFRIDYDELKEINQALIQDVREQREKNAEVMKKRWDTINTQKVKVGDFVLVDTRIVKKIISKVC